MTDDQHTIRFSEPLAAVYLEQADASLDRSDERQRRQECREEALERRQAELDAREAELSQKSRELEERERRLEENCRRVGELLESVRTARADILEDNEETIVAFTLSVARKVLQHEVENGHYKIGEIVQSALESVKTESSAVVRVNPQDEDLARRAVREDNGEGARLSVVPDPEVGRAACCIETDSGKIVSDIGARLERVEDNLLKRA